MIKSLVLDPPVDKQAILDDAADRLWKRQSYTVANALAEKSVSGITFTDVAGGIQIDIDSGVAAHASPRAGAALIWTLRDSLRGTPVNFGSPRFGGVLGFTGMLRHRLDAPTLPTGQEVDLLIGTCESTSLTRNVCSGIAAQTTPAPVIWRDNGGDSSSAVRTVDGAPGAGLVRTYSDYTRRPDVAACRNLSCFGDSAAEPTGSDVVSSVDYNVSSIIWRYHALIVRVRTLTTAPVSYVVRPLTIAQDDSQ